MGLIPVTDLKQWAYCERIVYYRHILAVTAKPTFKMKEAVSAQDLIESLEMRRGLRAYGLETARRRFGVWMNDAELGLAGKADLILESSDRVAVVDFKLTSGEVGENHRLQLAGYSMLAEVVYGARARVAFLYRIPDNHVFPIEITQDLRAGVERSAAQIRQMDENQWFPAATPIRNRCVECEYANYCADVW